MAKKVHHLEATNLVIDIVPHMKMRGDGTTEIEMVYKARNESDEERKPKEKRDDEIVFQTVEK